jgi:hypothetical protein
MKRTIFEGHGRFACPSLSYNSSGQVRDRRLVFVRNYLAEVGADRSPGEIPPPHEGFTCSEPPARKVRAHEVQTCIKHPHQCCRPAHHAR